MVFHTPYKWSIRCLYKWSVLKLKIKSLTVGLILDKHLIWKAHSDEYTLIAYLKQYASK